MPTIHNAKMLEKKWLGDKTGQGFYKKAGKDAEGRDLRHVLDWQTLDYLPSTRPKIPAIEMAKPIEQTGARLQQLLHGDPARDKAAAFYWPFLTELFTYAANRISADDSQPARDVVAIDQAMKTGFNWELGPFEMMDAVGPRVTTHKMQAQGAPVAIKCREITGRWRELVQGRSGDRFRTAVLSTRLRASTSRCRLRSGVSSIATVKKSRGGSEEESGCVADRSGERRSCD